MDAALGFGFRHALHTMAARFELERAEGVVTFDPHDDFAIAAQVGRAFGDEFGLPAALLGVAAVHAQQVAGKKRRFVAAGAGTNFDQRGSPVVGVARQEQSLQDHIFAVEQALRGGGFIVCEFAQLRVVAHLVGGLQIVMGLSPDLEMFNYFGQLGMLAPQLTEPVHVGGGLL